MNEKLTLVDGEADACWPTDCGELPKQVPRNLTLGIETINQHKAADLVSSSLMRALPRNDHDHLENIQRTTSIWLQ